jgi:hypothetical protein
MVFYSLGSNYIHIELMLSQQASDVLVEYKSGIDVITKRGLKPVVQQINKKSSFFTEAF